MQGIGAGIQWQSRPLVRLVVAVAVVAAIFVVAPPAHSIPATGTVNFVSTTSSAAEGTTPHSVGVILDVGGAANTLDAGFTVDVAIAAPSGSATGGGVDYTFSTATITFDTLDPHGTTKTIDIAIVDDDVDDNDEKIELALKDIANSTGASTIGPGNAHTVTIADNDDTFSVAFDVATSTQVEGNTGTTGKSVLVELTTSVPLTSAATVNVSRTSGSATPGVDFSFASPTLVTFGIGSVSGATQSVSVTVNGDTTPESNETVILGLSGVSGGGSIIAPSSYTLTITNDDFSVAFALATSFRLEGSSGTSSAVVEVVLDTGGATLVGGAATVSVGRTGGTATAGTDFVFASPTPVTFPAGSPNGTTRTVTVTVNGDTLRELDETVILGLSAVSAGGRIVAPTSHTLTIRNDDVDLGLSVLNAAPVTEAPGVTRLKFTVVLNPASGGVVTVKYATADGTAVAPGDYTPIATPTTLTFAPGDTSKDVFVTVANDAVDEITETVLLNLTDWTNTITPPDAQGVGTILDNDNAAPVVVQLTTTDAAGNQGFEFMTGQTVKLTGTFTDPGLADTHSVEVNWGDGKPSVFLPIVPVGKRSFESTHVYDAESFFGISVTVSDADPGGKGVMKETFVSVSGESVAEGDHRIGLVDPATGVWRLYDGAGNLATQFFFGNPGDYPFMGDWDGDGIETPGLYRQSDGFVYLTNTNSTSTANISFFFGNPGDIPIAGDFNGDGFDTVSIFRPSNQTAFIINELGEDGGGLGAADTAYVIGNPGDKPFVGDFDGNGTETVGLHRESTGLVYFRNAHSAGFADGQFLFGDPADRLVAGDWTGSGDFNPALFRPAATTMFFRYSNSQGNADFEWSAGESEWLPVSGVTGF